MDPTTTLEDDAALNEAARMALAEMKENPGSEVSLLVQAFIECGRAAAAQGLAAGRKETLDALFRWADCDGDTAGCIVEVEGTMGLKAWIDAQRKPGPVAP